MKRAAILLVLLLALTTGSVWCGMLLCSACHQPIRSRYYKLDNKKVMCESCYDMRRPVCVCCHKKIRGRYRVYKDGVTACEKCGADKSRPRCEICSCPIDKLSTKPIAGYGGYVCEKHRSEVVANYTVALGLMQDVRRQMVSALGTEIIIRRPVVLKLVSEQDLYKYYGETDMENMAGFCHSEGSGGTMKHIIYIKAGNSRAATYLVMAHELAHAWQRENNAELRRVRGTGSGQSRFVEGFAEWVAYKTTEAFGDKRESQRLLKKKNDVYRQGLCDFLEYEQMYGKRAVLEAAKTRTSL